MKRRANIPGSVWVYLRRLLGGRKGSGAFQAHAESMKRFRAAHSPLTPTGNRPGNLAAFVPAAAPQGDMKLSVAGDARRRAMPQAVSETWTHRFSRN